MLRQKALIGLVFLTLSLSFLPAIAEGAGFGGYTYRVRCPPQYMDNEPVRMDVQACRTTIQGKPMAEPVQVIIKQAFLINGTPQLPYKTVYNTTFTGSAKYHQLDIGRQPIGTWDVKAIFTYADDHQITTTFTYMVTHRPVKYWVMWLDDGHHLNIKAEENITVSVYEFRGSSTALIDSVSNVTDYNLTIHPTKDTVSMYVEIRDAYGWQNALSDQQYKYDYVTDPNAERYNIITISIVAGISILIIALLFFSTHKRGN